MPDDLDQLQRHPSLHDMPLGIGAHSSAECEAVVLENVMLKHVIVRNQQQLRPTTNTPATNEHRKLLFNFV